MFRLTLAATLLALAFIGTGCATHKEEKKCSGDKCCADSGASHKPHSSTHAKKHSQ
jgi:hypothetical protein